LNSLTIHEHDDDVAVVVDDEDGHDDDVVHTYLSLRLLFVQLTEYFSIWFETKNRLHF
jgi:hypothetical protein